MRKLLANSRSGLNRLIEILFKDLFRGRFRYYLFVSYSNKDAEE